ncbi:hypothetical protein [Dendronalium phyllosphericum]|uniref:hypothetical protein n=1 Tax=Dendronalium phyllosphericum TaxID=2840445 RepID=UPI001CED7060|nr:hypothetical protein [Dendronalium phyllosphericum]
MINTPSTANRIKPGMGRMTQQLLSKQGMDTQATVSSAKSGRLSGRARASAQPCLNCSTFDSWGVGTGE